MIPSRVEYARANLYDQLWFSKKDFNECVESARVQCEEYMIRENIYGNAMTKSEMQRVILAATLSARDETSSSETKSTHSMENLSEYMSVSKNNKINQSGIKTVGDFGLNLLKTKICG